MPAGYRELPRLGGISEPEMCTETCSHLLSVLLTVTHNAWEISWLFMQHFTYYTSEDVCWVHVPNIAKFSYSQRSMTESSDCVCVVALVWDAWSRESCKFIYFVFSLSGIGSLYSSLLHMYFNSYQGYQITVYSMLFYETSLMFLQKSIKSFFGQISQSWNAMLVSFNRKKRQSLVCLKL